MPKTPTAPTPKKTAAKSAARNTDSGPSRVTPAVTSDLPARQKADVQEMSAAMEP